MPNFPLQNCESRFGATLALYSIIHTEQQGTTGAECPPLVDVAW